MLRGLWSRLGPEHGADSQRRTSHFSRIGVQNCTEYCHTDLEDVPDDYTAFKIDIPDDLPVGTVSLSDLPDGWHEVDHPHCREVGDQWIRDNATPVLRVPSSVILHEPNFLISPIHPQAQPLQVVEQYLFTFDERLPRHKQQLPP